MRLLIYGGCHALILKRLVDELGDSPRTRVDLLINYDLVASNQPFNYDMLKNYDALIYSPIQNKGIYNTSYLDEACASSGVQAIRFPWLEWHGYAMSADKGQFWGHHGWHFPDLIALGRDFEDEQSFARTAIHEFPSAQTIRHLFDVTTQRLAAQEIETDCHVRVSGFIGENFRRRRLFLTPDHPTAELYRCVVEQIEALLGRRLIPSWSPDMPELQPEERTPILPRIAAETDLAFTDTSWRCETQPLGAMSLDAFLALHFQAGRRSRDVDGAPPEVVLATASRPTWASPIDPSAGEPGPAMLPIFHQALIRGRRPAAGDMHFTGEIIATLSGHEAAEATPRQLRGAYRLRAHDWIFRS